jgi:hypothetical protein
MEENPKQDYCSGSRLLQSLGAFAFRSVDPGYLDLQMSHQGRI